ncbi:UNC-like C-terminal-domain-containing protein [Mucor mucedo]|uniref:UNC-like C-terminal-domain-containing protein n=1 Tax=Mucor mucedo TaxID=29922 RepID=UPI002220101C|nr:UNC-like C-terminal-domain-containing protein [Mucor mucedo]KAI7894221.1 UNC-like C-terminal-domain-containing protein [Mucor mucedo]
MVDSIDGGFSDDFGSMFEELIGGVVGKEKKPNVYDEGEYIAPSKAGERNTNKKIQQMAGVRMKSLKERFNYASTDCAATVRKANKQAKGAQSILYESKDQYLLNKCAADKFVIINLCEQIVVDTIVMANFEFFSSTFKDFRVYASSKYPTKDWRLLGQWQARNTRDLQVFKVPDSGFVEYMKIEFLTHYGHEYYCPLSLVRVHGMSMMEYYTTVESQGDNPIVENEHLWPAEVREQLIQPQYDVTNTSESFPIKNDIDEEDIKPVIPPINYNALVDSAVVPTADMSDIVYDTEVIITDQEDASNESNISETDSITESHSTTTNSDSLVDQNVSHLALSSSSSSVASITLSSNSTKNPSDASEEGENETDKSMTTSSLTKSDTTISATRINITTAADSIISFSDAAHTTFLPSTGMTSEESRSTHLSHPKTTANNYPKEGSTQESIYKTIMKRLTVLEGNMTLSLRYLDDQNKNLNGVLKDMEKKHQEQLIQLIGHLNETASYRIDSMKRRYEQWYEDLKDQTDSDMREMTTKINILADQVN